MAKFLIGNIKGPKGDTGPTGPQGPAGTQGATGAQGLAGPAGPTGAQGPAGAQGNPGATWYTGMGVTGTNATAAVFTGSGVTSARVGDLYLNTETGNVYRCELAGAASVAKWAYKGCIKGPTGAQGAAGSQGPAGATGSQGPAGAAGAAGVSIGTITVTTDNTSSNSPKCTVTPGSVSGGKQPFTLAFTGLKGATGPQGATGPAGPQGAAGPTGPKGSDATVTYSSVISALGFTPVQQGGGTGQYGNKIYIGWTNARLNAQVDTLNLGNFIFEGDLEGFISKAWTDITAQCTYPQGSVQGGGARSFLKYNAITHQLVGQIEFVGANIMNQTIVCTLPENLAGNKFAGVCGFCGYKGDIFVTARISGGDLISNHSVHAAVSGPCYLINCVLEF